MTNLFLKSAGVAVARFAAIAVIATFAAVHPQQAAAQGDPLAGTWNLIPEKSTATPGPIRYKSMSLTFAAGTMEMDGVDVQGKPVKGSFQAIPDGKNHPITGMAEYDNATWSKFSETTTTYSYLKRKTTVALGSRILSRDGGVLTFSEKTFDDKGKQTRVTTLVFTKPGYVFVSAPPPEARAGVQIQLSVFTPEETAAIALLEKEDNDGAIAAFTKIIDAPKATPMAYYDRVSRGIAYTKKNMNDQALADFDEALKLKADDNDARFRRGSLRLNMKQYQPAIDDLSLVIKADEMNATAYRLRGFAYNVLGKDKDAAPDYDKACMLNKEYCQ